MAFDGGPQLNTSQPGYYNRGWNDPPPDVALSKTSSATPLTTTAVTAKKRSHQLLASKSQGLLMNTNSNNNNKHHSTDALVCDKKTPPVLAAPPKTKLPPNTATAAVEEQKKVEPESTIGPSNDSIGNTLQQHLDAGLAAPKITKQAAEDMKKRLGSLIEKVRAGQVSAPLRPLLLEFNEALSTSDYTKAGQIQTKLVAQHSTELGALAIGTKRLAHVFKSNLL
eukprot:m.77587 g.77587  ORF g.77587 m.77587 type:complete len:224 (-) comp20687_c0_seq3:259-930(-)